MPVSNTHRSPPGVRRPIEETRGEILRMLATLRNSPAVPAGSTRSAIDRRARVGPSPTVVAAIPHNLVLKETAPPLGRPGPSLIPDTGSRRLGLEQTSASSLEASITNIERRLTRIEQHLASHHFSGKTSFPPPSSKGMPLVAVGVSHPPGGRRGQMSGPPPSVRAVKALLEMQTSQGPPSLRSEQLAGSRAGQSTAEQRPDFDPPTSAGAEPPKQQPDAMFSGRIQGQMLSDMLQLASSNGMTGDFMVQCEIGPIHFYFEEGRIYHATGPGLKGEDAFFAAFATENGYYYFWETGELPAERTITSSTQFLILEALRQIDEGSQA